MESMIDLHAVTSSRSDTRVFVVEERKKYARGVLERGVYDEGAPSLDNYSEVTFHMLSRD